jgi:hypothetical protein
MTDQVDCPSCYGEPRGEMCCVCGDTGKVYKKTSDLYHQWKTINGNRQVLDYEQYPECRKASPAAQSAGCRPNQKVGSFTNMSEQERHELAGILEAELDALAAMKEVKK